MTKEETKRAIEVMQGFCDGKQIQFYNPDEEVWEDFYEGDTPYWAWDNTDYRIKPEKKIRPYKNAEEFMQAQKEHGLYIKVKKENMRFIMPTEVYAVSIRLPNDEVKSFNQVLNNCIWQDGSPCGIEEE